MSVVLYRNMVVTMSEMNGSVSEVWLFTQLNTG